MYSIRQSDTSSERLQQYAQLLSYVFQYARRYSRVQKFTADYLHWQYALNPHGPVVGFDAWDGNELAAHYVTIPVLYMVNGRVTKGLLSLNSATHPGHQGKGLFTKLASKTYELGKSLGYEFVIGVGNQNSTHGLLKLGFYLISPLDVKVGLGKIQTAPGTDVPLKAVWSRQALHWRLNPPSHTYGHAGQEVFADAGIMCVRAVLAVNEDIENNDLMRSYCTPFKMWIGIGNNLRLRGVFIDLPKPIRPAPLNLTFKDLTGRLPVFRKEDVSFELIDFDVY
jgi:GNAT superfamily N-acetyltransferase